MLSDPTNWRDKLAARAITREVARQEAALQTKLESLTEALINIAIGFVINFIGNWFILPLVGFTTLTVKDNLIIGGLFTIVSVARQYAIRRWAQQHLRRAKVVTAAYLSDLWKKFLEA
jgi:hypothetical protein